MFIEFSYCFSSDAPKLMKSLPNVELLIGDSFSILCLAITGTKPLKFEWFINNSLLDKSKIQSINDANSLLTFTSIETTDAGNYSCRVSNAHGSDMIFTLLSVKSKVFIFK